MSSLTIPAFRLVSGDELTPEDRARAMSECVHRHTGTHKPFWAQKPMPNGKPFPVAFVDCQQWLENTVFRVSLSGKLPAGPIDARSRGVWPNDPQLRAAEAEEARPRRAVNIRGLRINRLQLSDPSPAAGV